MMRENRVGCGLGSFAAKLLAAMAVTAAAVVCSSQLFGLASSFDEKAPKTLSIPLTIAVNSGCHIEKGEIRLFDRLASQVGNGPVVLEAEDALQLFFQPDVFARRAGDDMLQIKQSASEYRPQTDDPAASGKGYIDYCQDAKFNFSIATPGRYAVWARHWIPRPGSWNYHLQVDDQPTANITVSGESDGRPSSHEAKKWYWVRCPDWELDKGTHEIRLRFLNNGKRLDKFILTLDPKFQPEGSSLPATAFAAPSEGGVIFAPVKPVALKAWDRVQIEQLVPGEVVFDASTDGGKNWKRLPADLSLAGLSSVKPETAGSETLSLKMTLFRRDGKSPVVRNPSLSYFHNPEQIVVLDNEKVELFFGRQTGSLAGIRNKATGKAYTPIGANQEMFDILVKEPGKPERRWHSSSEAKLESIDRSGDKVEICWSILDDIKVEFEIRLTGGDLVDWDVTVKNGSKKLDVMEVIAPRIRGLRVSSLAEDDTMTWPFGAGEFIAFPASQGEISCQYLDHGGMPWIDIFTPEEGFYFAVHDPFLTATALISKAEPDQQSLELSVLRRHRIRAGSEQTYRFAIAAHQGDWHRAALLYRDFFYKHYPVNKYPKWLRNTDVWTVGGSVGVGLGKPYSGMIADYRRAAWIGTLHMQGWGSIGTGACPTYYMPRLDMGGEKVFAEMVRQWREVGGSTGYYFHGNSLTPYYVLTDNYFLRPWSDYPKDLLPPSWEWYEKNLSYPSEDSKPDREGWLAKTKKLDKDRAANSPELKDFQQVEENTTGYVPMTWSNWEFAEYLLKWVGRYAKEYNCNTAYLDTFAFWAREAEYNPYLGLHGETAIYMANKLAFLDRLLAEMRKSQPEAAILCEGVADVFGSRIFFLISGFAKDGNNILRYTLPDQIYFEGQCNALWDPEPAWRSTSHAFLLGNRLDIIHFHPEIFHLTRLRQRVGPFLNHSVFNDNLGLKVSNPDIRAFTHIISKDSAKFVPNDGSRTVTITILNENAKPGELSYTLPEGFDLKRAYLVELYRDPVPLKYELAGNTVRFAAPRASASAVILIDRLAGSEQWTALTNQLDRETIAVDLFNFSDLEQQITIAARHPAIKPGWQDSRKVTLPPGGLQRVIFKDPRPADEAKLVPIDATDASGIVQKLISYFGTPEKPLPPRQAKFSGPQAEYCFSFDNDIDTISDKAFKGSGCISIDGNGGLRYHIISFPLAPETEYEATLSMRKDPGVKESFLMACNYDSKGQLERYATLGNDIAADGKWHPLTFRFKTGTDVTNTGIYFYNNNNSGPDRVYVDELLVRRLSPAPPQAALAAVPAKSASSAPPAPARSKGTTILRADFEDDPKACSDNPHQGKRCLELKGNGKWNGHLLPLKLEPGAEYRLTCAIRKGFKASPIAHNGSVAVCNYATPEKMELYIQLGNEIQRDNRWHLLGGNFKATPGVKDVAVYLYNNDSEDSIWFDDITVQKLSQ